MAQDGGYYAAGPDRARKVEELFGQIARRYDLINDLQSFGLHRLWKNKLVRLARPAQGVHGLDVCTGTGDIALRLTAAGVHTVGCDFTEAMLEEARARSRLLSGCEWVRADALNLPFPSGAFDIVTVGYGLRNLADFERGISEMLRVLKPGGRLLVLEFGKPRNRFWRSAYFAYLRLAVPVFGRLFCGNSAAYSYILESLLHYPGQDGVDALLRGQGAGNTAVHNLLGGVMSINYAEKT